MPRDGFIGPCLQETVYEGPVGLVRLKGALELKGFG